MVARFEQSLPLGLADVNLRMKEPEDQILRAENFDDDLATQEREETRNSATVFRKVYDDAKRPFDEVAARAAANDTRMPGSVLLN
jgi:hypothetical protein